MTEITFDILYFSESESVKKDTEGSQDAWDNNSDTPDVTIEINGSTTTTLDGEESSVTEGEDNKANMTIDEFLGETETVANDLTEEAEEMFNNLITRATGKDIRRPCLGPEVIVLHVRPDLGGCWLPG